MSPWRLASTHPARDSWGVEHQLRYYVAVCPTCSLPVGWKKETGALRHRDTLGDDHPADHLQAEQFERGQDGTCSGH